jgi:ATP-dependent RNA helicase RhlE
VTFNKLGFGPEILSVLERKGYNKPTPIQAQAIPPVMKGKDVLGGAQTGTGKTAAFALPILHRLSETGKRERHPRSLVITPTRELADQVCTSFRSYGGNLNLNTVKIFGGVKINPQISSLKNGADVVVATPGRLLDHLNQKTINLKNVEVLVLDEADRMLDMGFIHDIKKILKKLPENRQNLLFSATYSKEIRSLASSVLKNPVNVEVTPRNTAAEKVEQAVHHVDKAQRKELLVHLIREGNWFQTLVFVSMKHGANRLAKYLDKNGIPSAAIHGDKSQGARTRALEQFKKGDIQALVATDIAARGLQIDNLDSVINFDLPQVPEDYVHRIGRTGRAGKSGKAISLVHPEARKQLQRIERILKQDIPVERADGFTPSAAPAEVSRSKATDHKPARKPASASQVRVKPDRKPYMKNGKGSGSSRNRKNTSPKQRSR